MPEIQYPKNPNSDTAFVVQEDGTKNRALMTAPQDTSTLELPSNANSTKGYVTVDGKKQRVILTADIGSGGGGGSYTAGTGIDITNNAISVQMPVKYNDDNSYAIGIGTQLGAFVYNSVAIGTMASAATEAVNIGGQGPVPQGTISIGNFQSTPSERGVVLFHTQDSNFNYHTYKMLGEDGTVPADRLASTTGLADGNYRLRCTITNGVPTLSWVAE